MADEKMNFTKSVVIVFALVSVLWVVQLIQHYELYDFTTYANHPRHVDGLKGIVFSPFIHDANNIDHLLSNTLPILILLTALINAYPKVAILVLVFIHLSTGVLVWLLAPESTRHVGISGIIYGVASFLVASGIFRKDRTSVTIAIFVGIVYAFMLGGFIPKEGLSWQSHLFGAISGIFIAFVLRNRDLPEPHEFELEKQEPEKHFFDRSGTD